MSNGNKKHHLKLVHRSDWEVVLNGKPAAVISNALMRRDHHGGYVFTDDKGVKADFPPGAVAGVKRIDPVLVEATA